VARHLTNAQCSVTRSTPYTPTSMSRFCHPWNHVRLDADFSRGLKAGMGSKMPWATYRTATTVVTSDTLVPCSPPVSLAVDSTLTAMYRPDGPARVLQSPRLPSPGLPFPRPLHSPEAPLPLPLPLPPPSPGVLLPPPSLSPEPGVLPLLDPPRPPRDPPSS